MIHEMNNQASPGCETGPGGSRGRALLIRMQRAFAAFILAVAVIGLSALAAPDAKAMPLALAKSAGVAQQTIQVRDGCGRGFRFSYSRQACVPDFVPPPVYVQPRVYYAPVCPSGMRYSNSMQRCVWIGPRW